MKSLTFVITVAGVGIKETKSHSFKRLRKHLCFGVDVILAFNFRLLQQGLSYHLVSQQPVNTATNLYL